MSFTLEKAKFQRYKKRIVILSFDLKNSKNQIKKFFAKKKIYKDIINNILFCMASIIVPYYNNSNYL